MKIKKLFSAGAVAALAMFAITAQANSIDANAARQAASNFMKRSMASKGMLKAPSTADIKLAYTEASSVEGNAFYVFNIDGGGWIIMAGDDHAKEVLAYGDKGNINMNELPGNMKAFLNMLKGQIETAQAYKGKTVPVKASKNRTVVEPLLKTTWGQGEPWNRLCPTNASGQRTSVGCAPLAMAQVVYYWKYPNEVTEIPGYAGTNFQYYSNLPATTFDYNLILDQYRYYDPVTGAPTVVDYTDEQANEVAKLCRYCGQACKSRYGNSGTSTGSYSYDQRDAFKTFGYNENLKLIGKDPSYYNDNSNRYTIEEWCELIRIELEAGHPIPYHDLWEGHAWVLDGVDADGKFHMNWGFNGKFDGWYEINALVFNPYGDDEVWDFSQSSNSGNEMVIGCYPYDGYVIPGATTTPRPSISYQLGDGTVTFSAQGNGDVHMYIDGQEVTSPYTMNLGANEVTVVVSATAQEQGMEISETVENTYVIPVASFVRGDVNKDGNVTIADVTALINYLLTNPDAIIIRNDTNSNGNVNISDVTSLVNYLLSKHW